MGEGLTVAAGSIQRDWKFSDQYLQEIRRIVGPHLLEQSSLEVDRHRAADLVVLRAKNLMIACRVRRSGYHQGYGSQFTLRSHRDSGAKTELSKIVDGWGDWLFYGFAAEEPGRLASWHLIDLHAFRAHLIRNPEKIRRGEQKNADGTGFYWFDLESFPREPSIWVARGQATATSAA